MTKAGFQIATDLSSGLRKQRLRLYDWLRHCLVGPDSNAELESDDFDLRGIKPLERYHVGILFPIEKGITGTDPASKESVEDEEDIPVSEDPEDDDAELAKPATIKRRYVPPSSAGFSFFVHGNDIRIQIVPSAVRYELNRSRDSDSGQFSKDLWIRKPFSDKHIHLPDFKPPEERIEHSERKQIFGDLAEVFVLWRPHGDGWLTTVSLSNRQKLPDEILPFEYKDKQNQLSIFETQLECIIESGEIGVYPRVDPDLLSEEDQELELLYKNRRIFAVGHGAAVDWEVKNGSVRKISIEFLPKVEVPQISFDSDGLNADVLELKYLAQYASNQKKIWVELKEFVQAYGEWVNGQHFSAESLSKMDKKVADRLLTRMNKAVKRMLQGVRLLGQDQHAAYAFSLANEAMHRQMKQYNQSQGKAEKRYRWRPFQLAFLLLVIESVVNDDSEYRDTLDLIWFPTGGGKTEAYFGLIAFLIAWRRLHHPTSGGGTTVLMRYTLRLLTKQQFQRATRLVCALELLRREQPSKLGHEPISVGMWVGEASSPNNFAKAQQIVTGSTGENTASLQKLILSSCPWCSQPFLPAKNFIATRSRFEFHCTNADCEFGESAAKEGALPLPCNVVDDALYKTPPTLLIATIDKFARLAWEERAEAFFGLNGNRPPELIIQDELHLITGALGSIAGLYEAALDTVLCHCGLYPKYIASTATIRMAEQQVRRLYSRPVAVFPPSGLSIEDSFFARTVPIEKMPGRLYVGYFAHNLTRQKSLAPLAAALLSAPEQLFTQQAERKILLDAWWTMVVYHGSLKGVGISHNALNIEVPEHWARYLAETAHDLRHDPDRKNNTSTDSLKIADRHAQFMGRIAQLTSISSPEENALTFKCLEKPFSDPACLDAVLATNMISVGVDVPRLAVMVVNGQPLTTAEYIQSSSRVGRGLVPGVVITNYYRDQARSLSHYESFRPYHESFYRFVEPSSITPYTYQARQRALHAALVIAVRHCCSRLRGNQKAGDFEPDSPDVQRVLDMLTQRCGRADCDHASDVKKHLQLLVEQWKNEALRCRQDKRRLDFQAPSNNYATDRLLFNHDDRIQGLWSTLQSMRNVENTALLKLL